MFSNAFRTSDNVALERKSKNAYRSRCVLLKKIVTTELRPAGTFRASIFEMPPENPNCALIFFSNSMSMLISSIIKVIISRLIFNASLHTCIIKI